MYKALVTDLDNTAVELASDGRDIDAITRQTVSRAIRAGYKLACATGRSWYLVKPVVDRLGFSDPCIIEGGTRIVDPATGKSLWEKHLSERAAEEIFLVFKQESSEGLLVVSNLEATRPIQEVETVESNLRFIYLLAVSKDCGIRIANRINAAGIGVAHFTPSWSGGDLIDVHVTHPEATKAHALRVWQKLMKVSHAETIGLGDSGNDIPIFQAAGLKVAVANATPDLSALADYIAPQATDHALAHVIDKFLLSQKP